MRSLFSTAFKFLNARTSASTGSYEPIEKQTVGSLLRKVKRIEILSNRIANDVFSGQYKSAFRGQGIEFDEVREYQEGDEVRSIDWNVTARSGKPYVKRFSEERERSLLFMLDVSASNLFGSKTSRLETSTEIVASLMFSAIKNNDKIGLLTFANGVRSYFPPQKGKNYALRLTKEMLSVKPTEEKTDLNSALEFVDKTLKRRAVVFILSDFYVPQLERPLLYCRHRHDLVAISISEPFEETFPNAGFVRLRDPETGNEVEVDAGSIRVRQAVSERLIAKRAALAEKLKEARVEPLFIENGGDYVHALREFFKARTKR
ncbi:MAG: DUF58 domain-containing protein [Thermoguttaceae bacterium]|nr:DUF58 domain-containing protein [Thermoguttaceae bacterium]